MLQMIQGAMVACDEEDAAERGMRRKLVNTAEIKNINHVR